MAKTTGNATKDEKKVFNVDYKLKKTIYVFENCMEAKLLVRSYSMRAADGIFEHVYENVEVKVIPDDVDRVVCVTGKNSWFSPIDSIIEICFTENGIQAINFTKHKFPWYPGGLITEVGGVTFKKMKVYFMKTDSRNEKVTRTEYARDQFKSLFDTMGIVLAPRDDRDKKKKDVKKDVNVPKNKKKMESAKAKEKEEVEKEKKSITSKNESIPAENVKENDDYHEEFEDDDKIESKETRE